MSNPAPASSQSSAPSSSASSAALSSSSEADPPSASTVASSSPSESTGSGTGGSGGKPGKAETITGLTKFYETSQHLPAGKAQKFATCMVGQMYDKASPATITAMRDGGPTKADQADAGLLARSGVKCQSALN